jgi:putative molybdopterin biosynthesis protein
MGAQAAGACCCNPAKITSIGDLQKSGIRVVTRQEGSGSAQLFAKLVADAGLTMEALNLVGRPLSNETDIAVAVRNGMAEAGLAIEAAARDQGLGYVPLEWERFDLVVRRLEFFEPGMQRLLSFARSDLFWDHAAALGGYDVANTGGVVFNAR